MWTKSVLAALAVAASAHPVLEQRQSRALDDFIARQFNISLNGALINIGGVNGNIVEAASPGIVVASPSTVNPDYFYTWTRDSALTQLMIADEIILGNDVVGNNSLQIIAEQYTGAQAALQTVTNPSGALWPAGLGLGEPKFYSNGTRFNNPWGRPQNDGPALRATTFMEISEAIFERNPNAFNIVSEVYWPMIYNDLLYVAQYWNTSSYDLWEEVNGNSFFTTTAQHRALVQGSIWAERLNQTCEACEQAPEILCFLQSDFWNETGNYILANINANQVVRSQINADPILAAMHAFDINATCDAGAMQPCNSRVLATHKVWVDSFRTIYDINQNNSAPDPALCGRYPEDSYYGGNPWYITTLAAAEVLYDAVAQFSMAGEITVDNTSLAFWQDLYPDVETTTYSDYANVSSLLSAATEYADSFIDLISQYTPYNGTLNEQINRTTGEPLSAIALTWSYAAFVTAIERRGGNFPPSWGANSTFGNNGTETCSASTYNATTQYTPALAAGAESVDTPCESEINFRVLYVTGDGENTFIVGNTTLLGNTLNNTDDVILVLRTNDYVPDDPVWFTPAFVPAGETIAYKFVVRNSTDNSYKFENVTRYVTAPECGNYTALIAESEASFSEDA